MNEDNSKAADVSLDYHFNERQIKQMAHFFRKHQSEIPDALIDFSMKIERMVYSTMSIEEAEVFFS